MKILTIIDAFGTGGKERRLIELLKGLTERQINCEVIALSRDVTYPELFDLNIKIHYLERKFKKDPSIFGKIYNITRRSQPDLIQSWSSMTSIYMLPVAKLLNIPFVNAIIVDAPHYVKPFSQPWLRRRLTFPFSDAIIANSHAGIQSYKAPLNRSYVMHNGFDFKRIQHIAPAHDVRTQFSIKTQKVVGMVGKFQIRKDYTTYLKAAMQLVSQRSDVTFLAIGDGETLTDCQHLLSNIHKERIIFTGRQENVESLINIFDVGVLTTNHKVHGEGISNALMEYMALGKPVIATAGGGTAELVTESVGVIIPPDNVEALVQKLTYLLDNPELAYEMGQRGQQRIEEHFNLSRMTDEYMALYENLLKIPASKRANT